MLNKYFDHKHFEAEITKKSAPVVAKTTVKNRKTTRFSITLPPPNVTGSLHLGHAFGSTLQDILLRYHRQHGEVTLGQPGLDHAGIATQMVVANQLKDHDINWQDLGREEFIRKVWEWKEESGGKILYQLLRLGVSIDLNRVHFTMDESSSKAVLKAFVKLYNDRLIYRDKMIVNWDTVLKTAVSDLEVNNRQESGHMWYIRYESAEKEGEFLTVATTRPETLFGDQAVAVHPEDERYQAWIGKQVKLPLTNRLIPVIADEHSDPTKGSGVVKITPAHDFNDFAVGKRHNLTVLNIMDASGCLNENVPEAYQGLTVPEARKRVLKALAWRNLIEKTEDIVHTVPYNDRSDSIIEPRVTDQWFVDAQKLAPRALQVVRDGEIKFVPDNWKNTYFDWLENIQPWCISRQIWWGHQIPVWHAPDGQMFCAASEEEAVEQAVQHYGVERSKLPPLTRDPDVLDTWFSSALWPFSTLGWPESTEDLKLYYPTNTLVTGFDIIFFWVARMIMMGLYLTDQVPFRTVYVTPLVRDEKGRKMSKSKGNVIDPLHLMDEYGTDAVRFTLAFLAIPGRDIKIGASLVENGRNFITKIWNAAKFLELSGCLAAEDSLHASGKAPLKHALSQWIVSQLGKFKSEEKKNIEEMRFDLFTQELMQFLKEIYCDVFIEGMKAELQQATPEVSKELIQVARGVFLEFLKVAHCVIPFVTEVLWSEFGCQEMLLTEPWSEEIPEVDATLAQDYIDLAAEIRSLRGMVGIPHSEKLDLVVEGEDAFLSGNQTWFTALTHLRSVEFGSISGVDGLRFSHKNGQFCLKYPQGIDASKAKTVFDKKFADLAADLQHLEKKLHNEAYKNAKPDEWAKDQDSYNQKRSEFERLEQIRL